MTYLPLLTRQALFALAAAALLILATPILPTMLVIQLKELRVDGMVYNAQLVRTVTFPSDAYMTYEIENEDGHALPECNRDGGIIHYEYRDQPLAFDLICAPPPGPHIMRYCVSATGWMNLRLAPSCIEAPFWSGTRPEIELQRQVIELQEQIKELKQ